MSFEARPISRSRTQPPTMSARPPASRAWRAIATAVSRLASAGDAESIVGIAEGRIELAAGGRPADRDGMAPRTSARRASQAGCRSGRVLRRRAGVVIAPVPVGTPLVHVGRDPEQT